MNIRPYLSFYLKDVLYVIALVAMYFAWHRDVQQCRAEQQSRYDSILERNRELERENAEVRARADFYSASHASQVSAMNSSLYEIKQRLFSRRPD
jgi:hypothetical protein